MLALQALIDKRKLTLDTWLRPDDNGGFEMGTWDFASYLDMFRSILNEDLSIKRKLDTSSEYLCLYEFTPKECETIYKHLLTCESTRRKRRGILSYITYEKEEGGYNRTITLRAKWYRRMLKLFKDGNVVYYGG